MKYRAGSRTAFLDQLKSSLEEYMDKDYKGVKNKQKGKQK